jgi:hypothetical protein
MGVGGQHYAPATFTPGKDPVPIVQEAGWASEPVWIGAENLAPIGIRSPNLLARSESYTDYAIPVYINQAKCPVVISNYDGNPLA